MKYLTWEIKAPERPGTQNAEKETASVTAYLLDWSVEERKKVRPAVVVCPGGGYRFVSPREGEPVAMQYLSMGYWWLGLFPGGLLVLVILLFFWLGRSVCALLDPASAHL